MVRELYLDNVPKVCRPRSDPDPYVCVSEKPELVPPSVKPSASIKATETLC